MNPTPLPALDSVASITQSFAELGYICTQRVATAVHIAHRLQRPILVEGPAGVGKTELAKTTADCIGLPLIRLQCYEGLDESKALYEWKYAKQLLYTQLLKDKLSDVLADAKSLDEAVERLHQQGDLFFSEHFLEPRPLLKALREERGAVLLIDEVDKSDEEFEAFLLEVLSDFQVSIPEIGTIRSVTRPLVFLTSNNTRELSDALKRRCLHLFIPFPEERLERRIVSARLPAATDRLTRQVVNFIQQVRQLDLKKLPSVSETIDWAQTLMLLSADELDADMVRDTLGVFLKFEEDLERIEAQLGTLVSQAHRATQTIAAGS
ncbi:MAG: MoxR family ATPase [Gammaproteobacteria bacterium]|nr:MoxR family ATPase [Gammaproteobacteria bacterium]